MDRADRVGGAGLSPSILSMLRDLHLHALTLASFGRAPRGSARAREAARSAGVAGWEAGAEGLGTPLRVPMKVEREGRV